MKWVKYRDKPACRWQSPYFMPREAARLFLRVTDVRVERLQQIMERGPLSAQAEGFVNDIDIINGGGKSEAKHFSEFWDSTIKKPTDRALYGWAANPWVWVIEFDRCGKQEENTWAALEPAIALLITQIAFMCGKCASLLERRCMDCGGEYLLILIPVIYYITKQIIADWLTEIRSWKGGGKRG